MRGVALAYKFASPMWEPDHDQTLVASGAPYDTGEKLGELTSKSP
jgi:hypothetical protein